MSRRKVSAQAGASQINHAGCRDDISDYLQPIRKIVYGKPRSAKKNCREKKGEEYIKMINFKNMSRNSQCQTSQKNAADQQGNYRKRRVEGNFRAEKND